MKKILAILSAALLCFATVAGAEYTDTGDSSYEKAIDILTRLCIVEGDGDGAFRPNASVSRAEFTAFVIRMLGMERVAKGIETDQRFVDVPREHWAYGYIALAESMDLIDGLGDGSFAPEASVTGVEALKITTSALGYGLLARNSGGYPTGYLVAGQRAGLLDSLKTVDMGQPLTRGQSAQMIYNALEAPMLETTSRGTLEESDRTVLADYLGVESYRGIVTANELTALSGPDTVKAGYVRIETEDGDTVTYEVGDTEAIDLIGYRVRYYSYGGRDTQNDEILWIAPDRPEEQTMLLDRADIAADATLASFSYSEEDGGKMLTADIASNAKVIYNGRLWEAAADELLRPALGSIRLIDNTRDNRYDVLIIEDCRGYVVDRYNAENETIVVQKNGYNVFSIKTEKSSQRHVLIYRGGKTIAPEDLEEGEVIAVMQSKDGQALVVRAGGGSITGTIQELWTEDDNTWARLDDGEAYVMTDGVSSAVKVGDSGTFYCIGQYIVLSAADVDAAEEYAVLLDTAGASGLAYPQAKLLRRDGQIQVLDLASRVRISSGYQSAVRYDGASQELLSLLNRNREELVIITTNAEGKLSELSLPVDNTAISSYIGYMEDIFSKDKAADLYYKQISPPTLGGEYMLTEDSIVFNISKLTAAGKEVEEEDYYAGNYDVFVRDRSYVVDIYDATPSLKAQAVVIREEGQIEAKDLTPFNTESMLVEKMTAVVDEQGEERIAISGLLGGERVTELLKDDVTDDDTGKRIDAMLEPGAVIQIKKNMKGEVENARVLYLPSVDSYERELAWSGSGASVDLYTIKGMVTYVEPDVVCISADGGQTSKPFAIGTAKIYQYSKRTGKVSVADYEDFTPSRESISDASEVFLRTYRNEVGEIILYED